MKSIVLELILIFAIFQQIYTFQTSQNSIDYQDINNDYFEEGFIDGEYSYENVLKRIQNTPYFMQDYQQYQHNDIIEPYSEDLGRMFSAFSQAVYCKTKKIQKWKCGNPCKDFPDMSDVIVITNNKVLKNNKAFVGYYTPLNMITIVWKGTLNIQNIIQDLDIIKTKYPFCEGCQVTEGWFAAYNSMQDQFWDAFNTLREKYPYAKIGLTGHSLGGSLSTFNAADLIEHGINGFVWYNFGSPRVGNEAFSTWLQNQYTQRLYRVTHHKDPAPHYPPMDLGFHHLAIEVFYVHSSKPNKEHIICNLSGEDPECSDRYLLDINVLDHLYYEGYSYGINIPKCQI